MAECGREELYLLGASFPSSGKSCVFQALLSKYDSPEINEMDFSD